MFRLLMLSITLLLSACTANRVSDTYVLSTHDRVALLPIVNHSQTPLAGESTENLLSSLWYQKQLPGLVIYPHQTNSGFPILDEQVRLNNAHQWLSSQQHIDYYLQGSVEEWRYKAGLDGEPVVCITLTLFRIGDTTPVWSGTIAQTGWGRDNLAGTAQQVLRQLLSDIEVNR